jgi:rare lipoprotein A
MITRAIRAFPGIVVSLLLATPVFAPTAHAAEPASAATTQPRKPVRPQATKAKAPVNAPILHTDGWSQSGMASWYGGARWHGKKTASGAVYDENLHTAAHATLPIGSKIKVVVANTGRSLVVTINDRPGTRTRIIDLSRGAAEALGIVQRGIALVSLQPA